MVAEELLNLANLEGFVAHQVKKEFGQEGRFAFIGRDDDGVGLGGRLGEASVGIWEQLGVGVAGLATKGSESGVGEGLSGVWSGVTLEEEEGDVGFDIAEEVEGLRIVA